MKKRWLPLLLVLTLALGLLTVPAQADGTVLDGTGTLTGDTATLTISAAPASVAVGGEDVYVMFTVTMAMDSGNSHGAPAFSFVLTPSEGLTLATQKKADNSEFYYQVDPDGKVGAVKEITASEYAYEPTSGYFGAGGLNGSDGLAAGQTLTVMKIMGKIAAGTTGTQTLTVYTTEDVPAKDKFTAGVANGDQCKRVVVPASVAVASGATVSGKLVDDKAADVTSITGGTVELYKGETKVADGTLDNATGTYEFTNVSTGTYTVKAVNVVSGGKTLNGSLGITVADSNLTNQNVPVQQGIKGDVDNNGTADENDLVYMTRYFAHWVGYETIEVPYTADVDGVAGVNENDLVYLTRYYAHWVGYESLH